MSNNINIKNITIRFNIDICVDACNNSDNKNNNNNYSKNENVILKNTHAIYVIVLASR